MRAALEISDVREPVRRLPDPMLLVPAGIGMGTSGRPACSVSASAG
ncbi:hypothetical protein ACFQY7_47220 [Actinomadura luteofluorescens]